LQRRDTLPRVLVDVPVLWQQQPRKTLLRGAPHAPAKLIEIRDPETVGTMDEHGVGTRNVEPALDDRGAEQHVDRAGLELAHDTRECLRRHLSVRHGDPRFGNEAFEPALHQADGHHAVVEYKDLAAAIQLLADRVAENGVRVSRDFGLYRHTLAAAASAAGSCLARRSCSCRVYAGSAWPRASVRPPPAAPA
jgi:hypothetical protein